MNQSPKNQPQKVNRVLYLVLVTLLFAIAVVIAATGAASRARKKAQTPDTSVPPVSLETEAPPSTAPVTTDRQPTRLPVPNTEAPAPPDSEPAADTDTSEPTVEQVPLLLLPTNGLLAKKHDLSLQVYSATMEDYRVHNGIDIVTSEGAPVYAAADGTVTQVWDDPLLGHCLTLSHAGGSCTVYKNLAEDLAAGLAEGVTVTAGQLIGAVGESAMIEIAEEPHLHFEVTVDGVPVDPLDYFDESALVSLNTDLSFEA